MCNKNVPLGRNSCFWCSASKNIRFVTFGSLHLLEPLFVLGLSVKNYFPINLKQFVVIPSGIFICQWKTSEKIRFSVENFWKEKKGEDPVIDIHFDILRQNLLSVGIFTSPFTDGGKMTDVLRLTYRLRNISRWIIPPVSQFGEVWDDFIGLMWLVEFRKNEIAKTNKGVISLKVPQGQLTPASRKCTSSHVYRLSDCAYSYVCDVFTVSCEFAWVTECVIRYGSCKEENENGG